MRISIFIILSLIFSISGCELLGLSEPGKQPPTPAEKAVKPKKKTPPKPKVVASKAQKKDYKRPEYKNNTRRNPFQPNPEIIAPVVKAVAEERTKQPLEQFALSELQLVAIISSVTVPKAMFVDPTGFGNVLREGERLGRNGGVISDIRDNEVDIREGGGENGQSRVVTMKLREIALSAGDENDLSEDDREALKKLLDSEEGRKALQRTFDQAALGATSVDKTNTNTNTGSKSDSRFQGISPPRAK